jgi:IS4 transposase
MAPSFLTNNLKLAASTLAAVYKDRWQIEFGLVPEFETNS